MSNKKGIENSMLQRLRAAWQSRDEVKATDEWRRRVMTAVRAEASPLPVGDYSARLIWGVALSACCAAFVMVLIAYGTGSVQDIEATIRYFSNSHDWSLELFSM